LKEPVKIAEMIEKAIAALGEEGRKSEGLIEAKAKSMAEYDKQFAVACAKLKANGVPVGMIDRLAKGETAEILYARIVAEEALRAHYARMEQLQAQLNGLQSLNRYLSVL